MSAPPPTPPPPPPPKPLGSEKDHQVVWELIRQRPNPLYGIAFTVPVFLFYHFGVLLVDKHSQVDIVSTITLRLVEASPPAYYVLTPLALALALLLTVWVQMHRGKVLATPFRRVLWEAGAAAIVALGALMYVSRRVLPGEASAISLLRPAEKLVLSVGSAFHEELVFRALLISGATWAVTRFTKYKRARIITIWVCAVVSSVLFAGVHYFRIYSEPFAWSAAGYRALEAMIFATLYVLRGFAVAVYAHSFYNLVTAFVPVP
jgi:hypothetical protein